MKETKNSELTEQDLIEIEEILFSGEFDYLEPIEVHISSSDSNKKTIKFIENPMKRKLATDYILRQKEQRRLEKVNNAFFDKYFD
jgi:hypothetical protein